MAQLCQQALHFTRTSPSRASHGYNQLPRVSSKVQVLEDSCSLLRVPASVSPTDFIPVYGKKRCCLNKINFREISTFTTCLTTSSTAAFISQIYMNADNSNILTQCSLPSQLTRTAQKKIRDSINSLSASIYNLGCYNLVSLICKN